MLHSRFSGLFMIPCLAMAGWASACNTEVKAKVEKVPVVALKSEEEKASVTVKQESFDYEPKHRLRCKMRIP